MPETLRQLISRGPVDPSTALDILGQLLKALAFAHWRGVIYGDITPENIVLTSTDQATLAGSGTSIDTSMGTSLYAAPEQIKGSPPDERTDIFALGVVAYEMLTGRHPFGASDGLSTSSVLLGILYESPLEIPEATLAGLPPHIPPVLSIALAKDPKNRFRDATSFLDALKGTTAVADGVGPGEPPLRQTDSPRSSRRKRRWLIYVWLGALGVIALVVVVLSVAFGGNSGPGSPATVTSGGTTSTGLSAQAIAPTTTA